MMKPFTFAIVSLDAIDFSGIPESQRDAFVDAAVRMVADQTRTLLRCGPVRKGESMLLPSLFLLGTPYISDEDATAFSETWRLT